MNHRADITGAEVACIMCGKPTTKYAACRACWKRAARLAARYFLKFEMKKDGRLYDEAFQTARLKTLTNRYEARFKHRMRTRYLEMI